MLSQLLSQSSALVRTRDSVYLALGFFFLFAVNGIIVPFLSPTLISMGYSRTQAGLASGGFGVAVMLMPTLVGRWTDRYSTADRVIRIGLGLAAAAASALYFVRGEPPLLFFVLLACFAIFRAPLVPMHNALCLHAVQGDPGLYARLRLTGSIGFMVAASLVGLLAPGPKTFFGALALSTTVGFAFAFWLPKPAEPPAAQRRVAFWRNLDRRWWGWLLAVMLHWFALGPYHYGFTLLLQEQGVASELSGLAWSVGVAAEIVTFLFSGRVFARWSYRAVLFVAMGTGLVRWLIVGLAPSPAIVWLTQLLHGPGYALFYSACMEGIDRFAAGRNRASYQGLYATAVGGIASIAGMTTAGWLHDHMPLHRVMLCMVPVQLAALGILWRQPLMRR